MAALLDAPNSWGTFYYSSDAFSALQADPVNAQQIQNFHTIIAHHPQIRAEALPDAPTPDLEGVVFKIRDNLSGNGTGTFFTITTNIPDQPTENPPATLKFWILFPYSNPLASRAQQRTGAQHAIFIQQFGN